MKYLLTALFPFLLYQPKSTPTPLAVNVFWTNDTGMDADNIIYYHAESPLEWPDFKGAPGPSSPIAAITTSGFGYKADMKTLNGKGQINIGVYCFFNKDRSWVRPGRTTDYILTHEQHHFDASYLAANLFMQRVRNTSMSASDCNTILPQLYRECCDTMNKLQNDYDGQTHNGQLDDVQEKWNDYFVAKLRGITG